MSAIVAAVTPAVASGNTGRNVNLTAVRHNARVDFQSLLAAFREAQPTRPTHAAQSADPAYTVKKGDTLSAICAASLRSSGSKPSQADIMTAVRRLASANGIANPDRIFTGQQLDLSAVQPAGSTAAGAMAAAASPGPVKAAPPQGGGAMAPAEYELAVLVQAISGVRGKNAARTQRMVAGSTRITSPFGLRKNPFTRRAEYHSGIDIAAIPGSQVYPVRPGEVVFSGWQPGYGKVVIVSHSDGAETLYAHNQRNLVSRGQQIGWDTPVARVGSTGNSTGPHVHFEMRRNGRAVNPTATATASLEVAQAL
ncbi:MAG TPA: peptidoglycan DD-metalloendopeptidase family protein [Candidatus Bathyarchaeia archaeon]|nr:peptidoglycan DD-metalloendopeptidase family protein [Candidatus Bathyarchaeia archaeon]